MTLRQTIAPCDHCETKHEKRHNRTINGKVVFICDPCFSVLTEKHKPADKKRHAPVLSAAPPSKLQWTQSTVNSNIVHRLDLNETHYEVHEIAEYRHGRSRPATRVYFLMMRPKIQEYKTLADIEEEILCR